MLGIIALNVGILRHLGSRFPLPSFHMRLTVSSCSVVPFLRDIVQRYDDLYIR